MEIAFLKSVDYSLTFFYHTGNKIYTGCSALADGQKQKMCRNRKKKSTNEKERKTNEKNEKLVHVLLFFFSSFLVEFRKWNQEKGMDPRKKGASINRRFVRISFDDVPSYKRTVCKHPTAYK